MIIPQSIIFFQKCHDGKWQELPKLEKHQGCLMAMTWKSPIKQSEKSWRLTFKTLTQGVKDLNQCINIPYHVVYLQFDNPLIFIGLLIFELKWTFFHRMRIWCNCGMFGLVVTVERKLQKFEQIRSNLFHQLRSLHQTEKLNLGKTVSICNLFV